MEKVISPLVKNSSCTLIKKIKVSEIIEKYFLIYEINVERFFTDISEILVYECPISFYRFYFPLNISGDSQFYELLQKGEFYYVPWKWEHETSLKYINDNDKILEVGSGGNGFVKNMVNRGFDITGLELNVLSVQKGISEGLKVFNSTIQEHSQENENIYDIVCSYQVLEHISEPFSFIEGKLATLKSGGKMIICVPNNKSFFLKYNVNPPLNMPPHHMGLWDEISLSSLGKIFNLKILAIEYESLQHYHVDGYSDVFFSKYLPNKYIRYLFRKLGIKRILRYFINERKNKIRGHSILIVFQK